MNAKAEPIDLAQEATSLRSNEQVDESSGLDFLTSVLMTDDIDSTSSSGLEEAATILRSTLHRCSETDQHRGILFGNLCFVLYSRYLRLRDLDDLEQAIEAGRQAIKASPNESSEKATFLRNLGTSLNERYRVTGDRDDLAESISLTRWAVQMSSQRSSSEPMRKVFGHPFWSTPDLETDTRKATEDLETSLQMSRLAISSVPQDDPKMGDLLRDLAELLLERFYKMGILIDLEEAIELGQQMIKATPIDHSERPLRLNKLSIMFRSRFAQMGSLVDLDEALHLIQEAINLIQDTEPARLILANNLLTRLGDKYRRTDDVDDLDKAIRLGQELTTRAPTDDPNRAVFLNNLSFMMGEKYSRDAQLEDLDEAVQLSKAAIECMALEHPQRANFLSNLGNHLGNMYLETTDMDDLDDAIRTCQQAVDATPEEHPSRAAFCNNLAIQLGDKYMNTQDDEDLETAIAYYKLALYHKNAPPGVRVQAGRDIVRYCVSISDWEQAYEAAAHVTSLIVSLTPRSLEISDKQDVLLKLAGFPSEAAAVALSAGKDPLVALKLLEDGRGVLAASLEDLRTESIQLRESHPDLAKRLVECRRKLEDSITLVPVLNTEEAAWQPEGTQRFQAGHEFDKIVCEIRQKPGFEDFLLAPSERDMYNAARYGHIIVVNVSEFRCDALIVAETEVRLVPLPDLDVQEINTMACDYDMGSPKVLRWLWDVVVSHILKELNIAATPQEDENWPHLWWICTGPLSKFPIHAAGYHHKSTSNTALDRAISSYSSSIKALVHARRREAASPRSKRQALLIALEQTPGYASLPFAAKEALMVSGLFESMAVEVKQPDPKKKEILALLQNCTILHFAGHGANDIDPSRSRLLLEDRGNPLYVTDLLEANFRGNAPFLAYLSACGTGKIEDERYSDESIHLISGCQLAGFRHVIGTLWEVKDEMCLDIARITYQELGLGGMTDESVSSALHKAVREMRDQWLNSQKVKRGRKRGGMESIDSDLALDTGTDGEEGDGLEDDGNTRNASLMGVSKTKAADTERLRWVPYVHYGV